MSYETEEEQLEALKRWWDENGRAVIVGVVLGVAVIGGWRGWGWYTEQQLDQASLIYEGIPAEVGEADRERIVEAATALRTDYRRTTYAALAALAAARAAVIEDDLEDAAAWLSWAADNARDQRLAHIATARLARVLGENGEYDRALALVTGDVSPAWVALYAEIEGDLRLAAGNPAGAEVAYRRALNAEVEPIDRELVRLKLNRARGQLGGSGDGGGGETES